jgi:hypothetical protein
MGCERRLLEPRTPHERLFAGHAVTVVALALVPSFPEVLELDEIGSSRPALAVRDDFQCFEHVLNDVGPNAEEVAAPAHHARVREHVPERAHGSRFPRAGDSPGEESGKNAKEILQPDPALRSDEEVQMIARVRKLVHSYLVTTSVSTKRLAYDSGGRRSLHRPRPASARGAHDDVHRPPSRERPLELAEPGSDLAAVFRAPIDAKFQK